MAIKYTIPFFDDSNVKWRVDLDIPNYSGEIIELRGVGRTFCQIDYGASNEDPYEEILSSSVNVQLYNQNDEIDVRELQMLNDMEGRLHLYRDEVLEWSGYILPDGITRLMTGSPYSINITATDGLMLLENMPFQGVTNWPLPEGIINRSPLAFIRYVLFNTGNLNIRLPIRWTSSVLSDFYDDDGFAGSTGFGQLGQAWTDLNGETRSCMYLLRGLLSAFQMRIFQSNGRWNIERLNDVFTGDFSWKEINTTYGPTDIPELTLGTTGNNTVPMFVNENQVMMTKPLVSDVEVTYDHTQAENCLPNGGFDIFPIGSGMPTYWGFELRPGDNPSSNEYNSLNKRPGHSVELTNSSDATEEAVFSLNYDVPVDTNILFKRFLLGFAFMPTEFGFPKQSEDLIDWSTNPLKISVSLTYNEKYYYLNEFGYWIDETSPAHQQVVATDWNSSADTFTVYFDQNKSFFIGDQVDITIVRGGNVINKSVQFTETMDVENGTNYIVSQIQDGFTTSVNPWSVSINNTDNDSRNSASTRKIDGYFKYIYPKVDQLKIYDIASFQFEGKGGNTEILLPSIGENLTGFNGMMNIAFYIKPNQRYVLDDVYFRFEKNSDVYRSSINTGKKTNKEEKSIKISSSFTGFMLSNIALNYYDSAKEYKFYDNKYTGSLTGMTANAIMRLKHLARELFQGDIMVSDENGWKFNKTYNIEGKKFIPLNSRYNVETCIATVNSMECEDGDPVLSEKHYGSNETILSNTQ